MLFQLKMKEISTAAPYAGRGFEGIDPQQIQQDFNPRAVSDKSVDGKFQSTRPMRGATVSRLFDKLR